MHRLNTEPSDNTQTLQAKPSFFHRYRRRIALLMTLQVSTSAHASDISAITNALQGLLDILSGTTAHIICGIAVAGLGYLWVAGRMSLLNAFKIVVGLGVILGASDIVDLLI